MSADRKKIDRQRKRAAEEEKIAAER